MKDHRESKRNGLTHKVLLWYRFLQEVSICIMLLLVDQKWRKKLQEVAAKKIVQKNQYAREALSVLMS